MPRRHPVPLDDAAHAPEHLSTTKVAVGVDVLDALRGAVGPGAVSTAALERADSARDWWPLAAVWAAHGEVAARPEVVVRAHSSEQVAAVLRVAHRHGVPVTTAGGRSGVGGGAVPVAGGIVLDTRGLDGIAEIDETSLVARIRAGTFGDELEASLRSRGFTLGHWPQSMDISTLGGWLACRGAGQYSTRYGKIEDMVVGLEVVSAAGDVFHTGGAPRAATGPDLDQVFVGSEGALGVITEASLRIHRRPDADARAAYRFASFDDGLDACRRILQRGATPAVLRCYDDHEARQTYGVDGALLLVLDEADPAILEATMGIVDDEIGRTADAAAEDQAHVSDWLEHRNDVSALGRAIEAGLVVDTIEVAAPWSRLPRVYEDVLAALRGVAGSFTASAHCSHSYPDGGCCYFTFAGDAGTDLSAKDAFYRASIDAAVRTAHEAGAAISHHHGIGRTRAPYLREHLGDATYEVLVALKRALDPRGILNPGALGLPSPFLPDDWTWS